MSTFFADSATSAALWIVVKATVVLGVAALVQAIVHRRASAAARHMVWTLAVLGVLVVPVLSVILPDVPVPVRMATPDRVTPAPLAEHQVRQVDVSSVPASPPTSVDPVPDSSSPTAFSWPAALVGVYAAGALLMLARLMMQRWGVRRFARQAVEEQNSAWTELLAECARGMSVRRPVRLLRSRNRAIPMTFGTRRPSILIPAVAESWPDDRRRAVVLHELAHIARYDCLTQTLAFAACALYWFHPAVWWVARRLRIERELACDDRVIAAGTQPRDYAGHLLEIAYSFATHRAPALAVTMARPRQLESRMLAALDDARNRSVPARRVRVGGAAIALALVIPLASLQPTAVAADVVDLELDAAPAAMPMDAAPQATIERSLKPVEWPIVETARRLIHAAMATVAVPQEGSPGTWEIRPTTTAGVVHLRLVEVNSSSGSNVPIERLEGLTATQLTSAGGPVQFRVRRDAGTFTFEGVLRNGVGAGTFTFAPDQAFPAELQKRGFARPTALEQYQMARHDIGYAFIEELTKQGYSKPSTSELVRAGQHGVQATYLREMGTLGYRLGSLDALVTLRDHGVGPDYVRDLAQFGYKGLSADELRQARDHGISAEYVRAMRDAGYGDLPMSTLINARDHGVSAEYVRGLGEAGHKKVPLEQLVRVRDHGVSPEYVRDMAKLGYALPLDALVRARDHGVSVEFARDVAALGYTNLSMDALIRLRDHGVTPEYAKDLKSLGYDKLTTDDLVMLRDHGLTADRIRTANTRAGTRLPLDMLKSMAAGGFR